MARQIQDGSYTRCDERDLLSTLRRHCDRLVVVPGVRLGNTAGCRSLHCRHRRSDPGVLSQLARRRPLRLPGRLSAGRSGGAACRRSGGLLRRVHRRDTGVEETSPASDRQWPRINCQPGDARVTVFIAVERRILSKSQQHFDHVVWSAVFRQQPSDGQLARVYEYFCLTSSERSYAVTASEFILRVNSK